MHTETPLHTPVLEVVGLTAGHGGLAVVHDVTFTVAEGEVVALLGRNGAGKTTTLMALAGFATRLKGTVTIDGLEVTGAPWHRSKNKLATVLESHSIFASLTVAQNLKVARVSSSDAFDLFPELAGRVSTPAGVLSGGEQQMLALARAVCRQPRLLLIDEASFGLSPIVSRRIYERLRAIASSSRTAILLVEQHLDRLAQFVDRGLLMNEGRVVLELRGEEFDVRSSEIEAVYLGKTFTART
jgi:branched-chain amino acid transport system ATP-binding protein